MSGRWVVALLLLAPMLSSMAADPPSSTCMGVPATIVGQQGQELHGTEGVDVVVTHGASYVEGMGGDDLICVDADTTRVDIWAGDGDDRVDSSTATADLELYTNLGDGADHLWGGEGQEVVDNGGTYYDEDVGDTIRTNAGDDDATVGAGDIVDLGEGDDALGLHGSISQQRAIGGPGRDALYVFAWDREWGRWLVDNRREELRRGGRLLALWSSFTDFNIQLSGTTTFLGSRESEKLSFDPPTIHSTLRARLGAGDDHAIHWHGDAIGHLALHGGSGHDRFTTTLFYLDESAPVSLDLASGALTGRFRGNRLRSTVDGFEDAFASRPSGPLTVVGTQGPNLLKGWLLGSDRWPITLIGKGGDDQLRGSIHDDVLVGGPGHDVANGKGRVDRCDAEVRRNCET